MHFGTQRAHFQVLGIQNDYTWTRFQCHLKVLCEKCKLCLDRAGSIGLDFSSLVFVIWASWGALVARRFPGLSQRVPQLRILPIWNEFLTFWGAPRPPIGAHSLIFFRLFCEVRKVITFGELWAGAGGRGRGLPELSDSEILTKRFSTPCSP